MELMLLSNGGKQGKLLKFVLDDIVNFIGNDIEEIVFIPFARVLMDSEEYTQEVKNSFLSTNYRIKSVYENGDIYRNIHDAKCILVGGGNTFNLLYNLQKYNLLGIIREKIKIGLKYIAWSAGSNIASPTIKTTNDMPIIEVNSLTALNIIPYQINSHFIDSNDGQIGETREHRIKEFLAINTDEKVLCLRNGGYIKVIDDEISFLGSANARIYNNKGFIDIEPGTIIPLSS